MNDRSKHPLETDTPFPLQPTNWQPRFWFVAAILLLGIGVLAAGNYQFSGLSTLGITASIVAFAIAAGHFRQSQRQRRVPETTLSEFELAQKRLALRQRHRMFMLLWLGVFGVLVFLTIPFGGAVAGSLLPLTLFTLFMTIFYGLQTYYSSPGRIIKQPLIEQEMTWLFGETWQENTGSFEYTFAQDRIRLRRRNRWLFFLHLLVYVPVNAFVLYGIFDFAVKYREPTMQTICLPIPILWTLVLLLPHALQAFPTDGMLARRERKVAQTLQAEINNMYPTKAKNEEKAKTEKHFRVGDDGELVELDDTPVDLNEKPKREQQH
ncbi:MAG: hypothetical protein R3E39_27480 [Anaerolineae bacterium]